MRKIYAHENALKTFKTANPKVIDKLKFVIEYIADKKHPLCEPYVKHISTGKYSLFYELRIKAAKEMVRVIFYFSNNDIVLLYSFCKQDKRDTDRCLKAAYRMFESGGTKNTIDYALKKGIEVVNILESEKMRF